MKGQNVGDTISFEEIQPYYAQDEIDFVLADWEGVMHGGHGDPEHPWDRWAERTTTVIDGTGYACRASTLTTVNGRDVGWTYHVRIDGESFVWSRGGDTWLIVGEDL